MSRDRPIAPCRVFSLSAAPVLDLSLASLPTCPRPCAPAHLRTARNFKSRAVSSARMCPMRSLALVLVSPISLISWLGCWLRLRGFEGFECSFLPDDFSKAPQVNGSPRVVAGRGAHGVPRALRVPHSRATQVPIGCGIVKQRIAICALAGYWSRTHVTSPGARRRHAVGSALRVVYDSI